MAAEDKLIGIQHEGRVESGEINPQGVDSMRTRSRLTMVLTLGVLTLMGPLAYGQTGAVSSPPFLNSPWKFEVAPYVWLPAMQGDLTVRGRTADIDLDLGDTLELLFDAFKFAAMGRAEARKGNLLLTLDLLYLDLEDDQTTARGLETEVGLTLLITEFGMGYRLGTWPLSPDVLPAVSFDVLAGGRYAFLEPSIAIAGGPRGGIDVERDVDWIEPFVGGRFLLTLSKRVTIGVRGDVGGFGVGSDLTWSLVGSIQYHVSRHVSVGGGYRALDIDYMQGSGGLDVLMHGPLLGAVFRF
jgi:hypothetical protein